MPRRVSLPAADELFRTTGGSAVQPSAPQQSDEPRVPAPAGEPGEPGGRDLADDGAGGTAVPADTAGTGEPGGREQRSGPQVSVPSQNPGRQGANSAGGSAPYAGQDQQEARRPLSGRGAQTAPATPRGQAKGRQAASGSGGRRSRAANRRPSGRERHDEKITVYVSAEELMDLEHARLVLRGEHGLAVDRGRIVREAVAVVLADLESRGDASILVRRLRGR